MKKSQRITLTVVAAMGMAAARGQTQVTPIDPNNCEEIRKAGTAVPDNCRTTPAHGAHRGGFGSTAKTHSGGG
jgi:hypothetical protein